MLSNIYMLNFDRWLTGKHRFFIRYSDDLIRLDQSGDSLTQELQEISGRLNSIGLSLSENKTVLGRTEQGFDFLGYRFDLTGKSIPGHAEQTLETRLETMWFTSGDIGVSAKCRKALEIIGGWEQYYREKRNVSNILEYAALIYAANGDKEKLKSLKLQRKNVRNQYLDVCFFLTETWRRAGMEQAELFEYEQYYQLPEEGLCSRTDNESEPDPHRQELLKQYRKILSYEEADTAIEIMQLYTDLSQYEKAAVWQKRSAEIKRKKATPLQFHLKGEGNAPVMDDATAAKLMRLFAGREDMYCVDMRLNDHRQLQHQPIPLSVEVIKEHLSGKKTIATYVQRPNATVRMIVFDIDVSRKVQLQHENEPEQITNHKRIALKRTGELLRELERAGMSAYIEDTGGRGYHVWMLMEEWIPVRYATMFGEIIQKRCEERSLVMWRIR